MFFVDVRYRANRFGSLVATNLLEDLRQVGGARVEALTTSGGCDLLERVGIGLAEQHREDAYVLQLRRERREAVDEFAGIDSRVVLAVGQQHNRRVGVGIGALLLVSLLIRRLQRRVDRGAAVG